MPVPGVAVALRFKKSVPLLTEVEKDPVTLTVVDPVEEIV